MKSFLTSLFLIVLAPVLVAFFVANRREVVISFDPLSLEDPAFALSVPLWAGLSGTLLVGFVLGAIGMWISNTRLRARAGEQRRRVLELEREVAEARAAEPRGTHGGTSVPALRA